MSSGFHDLLYTGLRKVLLIGGEAFADKAASGSTKRANERRVREATQALSDENKRLDAKGKQLKTDYDNLDARHAKTTAEWQSLQAEHKTVKAAYSSLEDENKLLDAKGKQLAADYDDLHSRHVTTTAELDGLRADHKKVSAALSAMEAKHAMSKKSAKEMATSVGNRLAKGVVRNTSAIPAESIPYIGIGVTLSVTALDIYDACQTMKEVNELMKLLDQGQENADYCGTKLPTTRQVVERLRSDWQSSIKRVTEEVKSVPAGIGIPEVRLPTAGEARSVICPIFGEVSWLSC